MEPRQGKIIWMTGMSGSGKSTLCRAVKSLLEGENCVTILDGDDIRAGLCSDLGYSDMDREENVRRIAQVAKLLACQHITVLVAAISPTENIRRVARDIIPTHLQIYVKASLATCEARDTKGMYKKARAGLLVDFTGVNSSFEEPSSPDLICDTETSSVSDCASAIIAKFNECHFAEVDRSRSARN